MSSNLQQYFGDDYLYSLALSLARRIRSTGAPLLRRCLRDVGLVL